MKIKDEYKGKTIVTYDSVLGQRKIEVDKIDTKRFAYYVSMGLGYLFEKPTIAYTGIEHEVLQSDAVQDGETRTEQPTETRKKPATKTRKRKTNVTTN
jgi:hypothetical protein